MDYKVIYRAIVGSQAYGTAVEGKSDQDEKLVYIQSHADILSFKYQDFLEINKDNCGYEVRRFLELLKTANPTVLELLFGSEDCILEKSSEFDIILKHRDKFLTKQCYHSFGQYGAAQLKKATGLDKKMNWEKQRIERKTPLDFCYYYKEGKTYPLTKFLEENNIKQENCGLIALNHFRDCYTLYYGENKGYRGVVFENKSNDIHLSSIPFGEEAFAIIFYNKDGYSMHCNDYKEYQNWLEKRNTQRYVDVKSHGQKIDSKNLLHCRRLLNMAMEIGQGKGLIVKRPDAEELLKIRRGEVDLQSIINKAKEDIKSLDELFKNADLPDSVDEDFLNELLLEIRYYNFKK